MAAKKRRRRKNRAGVGRKRAQEAQKSSPGSGARGEGELADLKDGSAEVDEEAVFEAGRAKVAMQGEGCFAYLVTKIEDGVFHAARVAVDPEDPPFRP